MYYIYISLGLFPHPISYLLFRIFLKNALRPVCVHFQTHEFFFFGGPSTRFLIMACPYRGFAITLRHTTLRRNPLGYWSARRRDLYLTTHNTHNRQSSMAPERDSNEQYQQTRGCRFKTQTALVLGSSPLIDGLLEFTDFTILSNLQRQLYVNFNFVLPCIIV